MPFFAGPNEFPFNPGSSSLGCFRVQNRQEFRKREPKICRLLRLWGGEQQKASVGMRYKEMKEKKERKPCRRTQASMIGDASSG